VVRVDSMKFVDGLKHYLVQWAGSSPAQWVPEAQIVSEDGEICAPLVEFFRRVS